MTVNTTILTIALILLVSTYLWIVGIMLKDKNESLLGLFVFPVYIYVYAFRNISQTKVPLSINLCAILLFLVAFA